MAIISFIGFTLLVAVIAYLATRKTNENTSDGYFLGGRSLTAGVIAGSLLLTNLSTEQIVGLNGSAYSEGILVMAYLFIAKISKRRAYNSSSIFSKTLRCLYENNYLYFIFNGLCGSFITHYIVFWFYCH